MAGLLPPAWLMAYTAAVVLALLVVLVRAWMRPDLALLGALGLLLLGGAVPADRAFAGFSNPAVITVGALFVVAAGVERTGALARLDAVIFGRTQHLPLVLLRLMLPTAALSAFVNNTPLVALLAPRVQAWAERTGIAPSRLMIPLSYAAILGGVVTVLGTSTNVVVSGLLEAATGAPLGLFSQTAVGLPAMLVGVGAFALWAPRLLPERRPSLATEGAGRFHFEFRAGPALDGRTVGEAGLRHLGGAFLSHLVRGERVLGPIRPDEVVYRGDRLAFVGDEAAVDALLGSAELERAAGGLHPNGRHRPPLYEAVVSAASPLVGRTLQEAGFREQFGGVVVGIQRRDTPITSSLGRVPIQAGDLLLVEARPGFDARWGAERQAFYLVAQRRGEVPAPPAGRRPLALLLFGAMAASSAAGLLPLEAAAFLTALAMLATRCLSVREARQALDLPVLLMIAAALGVGAAVEATGLAAAVARPVVEAGAALGPLGAVAAVYLITMVMTEVLTNAAAAALVFPIAMSASQSLALDPVPFAVAVAIAASCAFATPFGYQTNLMVMSAGGYRPSDYARAGLPLNALVAAVSLLAIQVLWL